MTRDHVFPRVLFITMDPQMVTVPSCARCQTEKAKGDTELRAFVNMEIRGGEHPDAPAQLSRIARATMQNRSRIGQAARDRGWIGAHYDDDGQFLEPAFLVPLDDDAAIVATVKLIIRGLYYYETKIVLPLECPIRIGYIKPHRVPRLLATLSGIPHTNAVLKGNAVAGWVSFRTTDPLSSLWLLEFNGRVYVLGATGALADDWRRRRERMGEEEVRP